MTSILDRRHDTNIPMTTTTTDARALIEKMAAMECAGCILAWHLSGVKLHEDPDAHSKDCDRSGWHYPWFTEPCPCLTAVAAFQLCGECFDGDMGSKHQGTPSDCICSGTSHVLKSDAELLWALMKRGAFQPGQQLLERLKNLAASEGTLAP